MFAEFPSHLTHQEMFTMTQIFSPLKHKYLGSSMKNLENSRTILNPTTGLFLTHCVQQLLQSRLNVANNDLSLSSQHNG